MADPNVGDAIDAAARQYGLNPVVLKGIANIESSWDPGSNRNKPSTQYKGLFQLGREEWNKHGSGDIYNAQDNANAAARLLSSHSQWFQDRYGREPTPSELYMMHQQGRGFISNGTMTNIGNNAYQGMRGPQTPESFHKGWSDQLDRKMALYGDGGSVNAMPGGVQPTSDMVTTMPTPAPGAFSSMTDLMKNLGLSPSTPIPTPTAMAPQAMMKLAPTQGAAVGGATPTGAPAVAPGAAGLLSDPTADMTDPAKRIAAVRKAMEDEKTSAGDKQSKALMAMAQQFMTAGQAPKAQFASFQPMDTSPFRPIPLNLPPGFGSGRPG